MVCTCCGQWAVEAVVLQRSPSYPGVPLLRVTHHGALVAECRQPDEVAAVLGTYGVALDVLA